ncbi:hypothetical protein HPB50_004713 [Hyalomma asiaticum]|uniref:Uncharacterized protein n=1 Tax=Hyalomma asiaticum TaxID=266040 RepID=A0ACB7SSP8_HYAAI|nr:hypothetical protein HPB50_004713 [Hyalomma asiaticum]
MLAQKLLSESTVPRPSRAQNVSWLWTRLTRSPAPRRRAQHPAGNASDAAANARRLMLEEELTWAATSRRRIGGSRGFVYPSRLCRRGGVKGAFIYYTWRTRQLVWPSCMLMTAEAAAAAAAGTANEKVRVDEEV